MSPPASKGTPKKETAAAKRTAAARQRNARQNSNVKSRAYVSTDSSSSDEEQSSTKKRATTKTNSPKTTKCRQSNENLHLNNGNGAARTPTADQPKQSRQKAIAKMSSPVVNDSAGETLAKKGRGAWSSTQSLLSPRQMRNSISPRGASSVRSKKTVTSSDDDDDDDEDNSDGSKSGKTQQRTMQLSRSED